MPHKNIEDRRKYAKEYLASHPEAGEKRALIITISKDNV